ncbi:MAG: DUF262 domain-containing protein [Opitutales bacterium]|nr:DUF262 domain-containing protein [Opitutales bacterium]
MNNEISQLSVRNLLSGEANYTIPMYQRNYAWDEGEITQLIQDVIDYLPETRNYYIGTLVVFERIDGKRSTYETIDGQQRLTTLSLLASYLKNEKKCDVSWYKKLAIDFDSREHSRQTFSEIFSGRFTNDPAEVLDPKEINTAILNGYRLVKKILPQKLAENRIDPHQFSYFLFEKVQIMRVKVPKDTDLNHYFEIMNNRGEQLEKHEVLKSRMMQALKNDKESQHCLHLVWEACSNMEKYVQMGFPPEQRDAIFGTKDWSRFDVYNFEMLREKVTQETNGLPNRDSEQTLDEIIRQARDYLTLNKENETPERFNTVINFPNFLLHVLRIQTEQDVPLDDKRLISTFESNVLRGNDAAEKVKKFTFNLLRCKFLYDQYIIKREFITGKDGWSLKRLSTDQQGKPYYKNTFGDEDANGSENKRILMLLSAFHVSTPTLVYKHWLNAALNHLFDTEKILADTYLHHLESVAKAFVFDRFLSENRGLDYFEMIFKNKGVCQTERKTVSKEHLEKKLSFGNVENNLVFNFLDYLLWIKHKATNSTINDFEFTFRSSVEHYYPQHPLPGHDSLPSESLNSFGNLCLISHSKNSRLSNYMPEAKKEHYRNNTIDSVKQYIMMKEDKWGKTQISRHLEDMTSELLDSLE